MQGSNRGDGDPLDICVFAERPINRAEVILNARIVGGLPMLDDREADDKIIAVLANDNVWGRVDSIEEFPPALVERLRHYFMTYKLIPGETASTQIGEAYGRQHAEQVIQAAIDDYVDEFGG